MILIASSLGGPAIGYFTGAARRGSDCSSSSGSPCSPLGDPARQASRFTVRRGGVAVHAPALGPKNSGPTSAGRCRGRGREKCEVPEA